MKITTMGSSTECLINVCTKIYRYDSIFYVYFLSLIHVVKEPEPMCRRRALDKAKQMCSPLKTSSYERGVFSACQKAVPMERFFK